MFLNLETSSKYCSVAISKDTITLDSIKSNIINNHSNEIANFVKEILRKTEIEINQLKAVAVSSGPGSFTGLRIGVSLAKAIAYSKKIPLIAVDSLTIIGYAFKDQKKIETNAYICPVLDGRKGMIFFQCMDSNLNVITNSKLINCEDELLKSLVQSGKKIYFIGNGANLIKFDSENIEKITDVEPEAQFMKEIVYKKFIKKNFEDVIYFEPQYLKEFEATIPKNKLL